MQVDYSPYGSDYYLDESGRKDSARFALEQLYEATGVPAFKRYKQAIKDEYTPGRKSALHLAEAMAGVVGLGSISPQSLNITKKEMLKSLGRSASAVKQLVADVPFEAKEVVYRTRGVGKEIKEAPEIFEPIKSFAVGLTDPAYDTVDRQLRLGALDMSPRILRHEVHHANTESITPEYLNDYIKKYGPADENANAVSLRDLLNKLKNKIPYAGRKFVEDITGLHDLETVHGFHPEEIAAINAEDIPLRLYKDRSDYLGRLQDRLLNSRLESIFREDELNKLLYRSISENEGWSKIGYPLKRKLMRSFTR